MFWKGEAVVWRRIRSWFERWWRPAPVKEGQPIGAAPAAPAQGRRRQALLQGRLTAADVAALRADGSARTRAGIAAKLGRQLDALWAGPEREVADAVLRLLARDLAKEVRQALAEAVADSDSLPPAVARQLAHDEIEVARPLLERSRALADEDLIAVVRTQAQQYALAVAGRERLSEAVAEALVGTGEHEVVARLVGNHGARLSQATMLRVVEDFHHDDEIRARLVRRPELPFEVVESLVRVIGERLESRLVASHSMRPEEARAVMGAVRERAAIGFTARGHADGSLQRYLREERLAGRLDHDRLLRFLREGDVAALEVGLALHAGIEPALARRLLYDPDRRRLAALCLEAGFSVPHYLALRMALEIAQEALGPQVGLRRGYTPETLRFLQAQYEQLGADDGARARLLAA